MLSRALALLARCTCPHGPPALAGAGADLANLVNTAALKASMANAKVVTQQHLEWALDRLALGNERRDVRTEQEIRLTAFHEGGHALVALLTDGAGPVHKATILPRGRALGVVRAHRTRVETLPTAGRAQRARRALVQVVQRETSEVARTRKELLAALDVCMGGRVAEELIFGKEDVTTGALSDMQKATSIARSLVEKYAMSDWGIEFVDDRTNLSAAQREKLDQEVTKILEVRRAPHHASPAPSARSSRHEPRCRSRTPAFAPRSRGIRRAWTAWPRPSSNTRPCRETSCRW